MEKCGNVSKDDVSLTSSQTFHLANFVSKTYIEIVLFHINICDG